MTRLRIGGKPFWDRVEIACVVLGGALSALTASQTQDFKRIPASLAFGFTAMIGVARWRSKEIEEREKAEKARQEAASRARQARELDALKDEHANVARLIMAAILEDLRDKYFRGGSPESMHHHRATLFACDEHDGESGEGKRLAIFARAGVHQDSRCSWPVDEDDPARCRGVAGQVWFHGVGRVVTAGCDWPTDGDAVQMARYAASLGITMDEAVGLRVKSRAFAGTIILAGGRKWGVLVLDSLVRGHIRDSPYEKGLINRYANLIGSVVGRMGL